MGRNDLITWRVLTWPLLLLLSACTTPIGDRTEYPSFLPKPESSGGECPKFAGFFSNTGSHVERNGTQSPAVFTRDVLQLGDTFAPLDDIQLSLNTRIVNSFVIESLAKTTEARLRIESKSGRLWEESSWGIELCNKGSLILPTNRRTAEIGGAPGLVVAHGESAHLVVGQDGSLIAMRQKVNAGVVIIFPWYAREYAYYRFPRTGGK